MSDLTEIEVERDGIIYKLLVPAADPLSWSGIIDAFMASEIRESSDAPEARIEPGDDQFQH